MRTYTSDTYFNTQSEALDYANDMAIGKGYTPQYPDHLWVEHVNYGTNARYTIPMLTQRGNPAKKHLHISLYRMDSGRYELITWLQ